MGIFSLFGKKDAQQQKKPADKDAPRAKRPSTPGSDAKVASGKSGSEPKSGSDRKSASERAAPNVPTRRDLNTAHATVLKIDAIESEMSSEFVKTNPPQKPGTNPAPARPAPGSAAPAAKAPATASKGAPGAKPAAAEPGASAPTTLQPLGTGIGSTTDFLLNGNSTVGVAAAPSNEAAAVIEESAIMYANGQTQLVEQMLRAAITEDLLGEVTHTAWWMLFDLYQLTGKREAFEQLAVEYANKFETSPPGWRDADAKEEAPSGAAGSTPAVAFSGKLDANAARNIERVKKLAETHRSLRLEFLRVAEVEQTGCQLLLALLKQLQKSGHELVLVGARELADKVRGITEVGRREGEDCWLLLLEILRLLNAEKEFEETSIDYCVTFEVSPPAFVAPQSSVTTAAGEQAAVSEVEGYRMPALVEGRIDNLILAIAAYSDDHDPAIIDCSQLVRVDFNAVGRLLTGLAPFCGSGKAIEFHHVNHLVAELFNVIGLKDIVRIVPRKA